MPLDPTVYVVDDDQAVRDSIVFLLEAANLAVQAFSCSEEFLQSYQANHPGCLIVDISLPGMSGLELQDALHAKRISIPIIFITGHGDALMSQSALNSGAIDFIEKPFDSEVLLNLVRGAIAWAR